MKANFICLNLIRIDGARDLSQLFATATQVRLDAPAAMNHNPLNVGGYCVSEFLID